MHCRRGAAGEGRGPQRGRGLRGASEGAFGGPRGWEGRGRPNRKDQGPEVGDWEGRGLGGEGGAAGRGPPLRAWSCLTQGRACGARLEEEAVAL